MIRSYQITDICKRRVKSVRVVRLRWKVINPGPYQNGPCKSGAAAEDYYWDMRAYNLEEWPVNTPVEAIGTMIRTEWTRFYSTTTEFKPPFDGSARGEFFDIKRRALNENEQFPQIEDSVDINVEPLQVTFCKFFIVIYVRNFYITTVYKNGNSTSQMHHEVRCYVCENMSYIPHV